MPRTDNPVIQTTPVQRVLLPGILIIGSSIALGLSTNAGSVRSLFVGALIGGIVLLVVSARRYLELTDEALIVYSQFSKGSIPWAEITDLRVEEVLGGRGLTIEAFGKINRLAAPVEGRLFWADPAFDEKAEMVIAAWTEATKRSKKGKGKGGGRA